MEKVKQFLKIKTVNFGIILAFFSIVQMYVDTLNHPLATMAAGIIVIILDKKQPKH